MTRPNRANRLNAVVATLALAAFVSGSNHCLIASAGAGPSSRVPACHAKMATADHGGPACCRPAAPSKESDRRDAKAPLSPCCIVSALPGPAPALEPGIGGTPVADAVLVAHTTSPASVSDRRGAVHRSSTSPPPAPACDPHAARAPPLA